MSTDINTAYLTTQAAQSASKNSSTKGVMALGAGMDFLSMMMGQIAFNTDDNGKSNNNQQNALLHHTQINFKSAATMPQVKVFDGLRLLMDQVTAQIDPDIDSGPVAAEEDLKAMVAHLLAGTPDNKGKAMMLDIEAALKASGADTRALDLSVTTEMLDTVKDSALISTGLSPEALTKFMEQLKQRTEAGESFLVGLVNILPPKAKPDIIFHPQALVIPNGAISQNGELSDEAMQDIAAQLNLIAPGAQGQRKAVDFTMHNNGIPPAFQAIFEAFSLREGQNISQSGKAGERISFGQMLQAMKGEAADKTIQTIQNIGQNVGSGLSLFMAQSSPLALGSSAQGIMNLFPDGVGWQPLDADGIPGMSFHGAAPHSSLLVNAPQAAQPHPTAQHVAATITKAAKDGQSKTLNLRLDPPDLGRLDIRLEFGKDSKKLKAVMVIEKPETYLMLQRDAQTLERSLQQAGLELDGDSLSFSLAGEDHDFNDQNGQRQGGTGYGGETDGEAGDEEIIETKLDWYIDPDTGLTRYSILA